MANRLINKIMSQFLSEDEISQYEFMMKQAEPRSIREAQKEIDFGIPAYAKPVAIPTTSYIPSVVRRRNKNHKRVYFRKIKTTL